MSFYNFNEKFIDFIFQSIFLFDEMWLGILVMMFLFSKYKKLNIFLICVHNSKTVNKMKQKKYLLIPF